MKHALKFSSILFILGAIVFTGYYIFILLDDSLLLACNQSENRCDNVSKTHWALVLSIPIIYIGGFIYSCFLLSNFFKTKPWLDKLTLIISYVIIIGAIWFLVIQAFIIKEYCTHCCIIHSLASVAAALWILNNRLLKQKKALFSALTLVLLMAFTQITFPSIPAKRHKTTEFLSIKFNKNKIDLYDGKLSIQKKELPKIILSESNSNKFSLFLSDYTCPHCLGQHITYYENANDLKKLGTLYHIPCYQTKESKELSRILLIVSKIDKKTYLHILKELRDGNIGSKPSAIRKIAEEKLNGNYKFYHKTFFTWAERILNYGKKLMLLNQEYAQASSFPQLMIGDKLIEGAINLNTYKKLVTKSNGSLRLHTNTTPLSASDSSKLVFQNNAFHLGTITKNNIGYEKITIKNASKKTVYIDKVRTSCGCIKILDDLKKIKSLETVHIPFQFSTKKFLGPVTHKIIIYEKGIRKPSVIPVSVDVWLPFQILPYKNNLGKVTRGSNTQIKQVNLINNSEIPVQLKLYQKSNSHLKAKLSQVIAGSHYRLTYEIENMPNENLNTEITLNTSHPDCPKIHIPIIAIAAPLYELQPNVIQRSPKNSKLVQKFYVHCYDQNISIPKITTIQYEGIQSKKIKITLLEKKHPEHPTGFSLKTLKGFNFEQAVQNKGCLLINTNFSEKPIALYFSSASDKK